MSSINLKQNFARIIRTLEGQGLKPTNLAKSIGYTTTTQLNTAIAGDSLLSTKAIMGLIENLNVSPIYLFLGKGDMFLTDENEIDKLRKENQSWIQKYSEADVRKGYSQNNRNTDLIDMSVAAIKFHKEQKDEEQTDLSMVAVTNKRLIQLLKYYGYLNNENGEINIVELESSLKRDKK